MTSPFGQLRREPAPELVSKRKQRMLKAGYFTPEEYFDMPLTELNRLAKKQDIFALLQLAERYYFEHQELQYEDGYDFEHTPTAIGLAYFTKAAELGHGGVLPSLIKLEQESGDAASAYAWYLFAGKVAQPLGEKFDWSTLTEQDRKRALQLADRHLLALPMYR